MARLRDLALVLVASLAGCPDERAPTSTPSAAPAPRLTSSLPEGALPQRLTALPDEGPVYAVPGGWPQHTAPLAPGAGAATLQAHCSTCHSTTYVTMQPPLPAAAWKATVDKMLKTYGAQIPDAAAQEVLTYLAAHYTPETVEATYAALAGAPPAADDRGAQVYRATCAACHQQDGQGLPGAFPPLVKHVPALLATRRAHLARLVLHGQQGPIEALGQRFDSAMPGFPNLTDAEVAAVLNHVARAWGNEAHQPAGFAPFTPEEVAAERAKALTPRQVHSLR